MNSLDNSTGVCDICPAELLRLAPLEIDAILTRLTTIEKRSRFKKANQVKTEGSRPVEDSGSATSDLNFNITATRENDTPPVCLES